ncbi:MAG: LysR family transcriptional regulator [Pseudomonadota bacterium]
MSSLNYHHLRYFREVAHTGHLTRAAEQLNLSQSALSSQIKQLEARLGHPLFNRIGRRLELTEVGRIALDHADRIFETGDDLLAVLNGQTEAMPPLRAGAQSTLSRNFQMRMLRPALAQDGLQVVLRSGLATDLLSDLRDLNLDIVLTTEPVVDATGDLVSRRVAEQAVALHGAPSRMDHPDLAALLRSQPLILPSDPALKSALAALADRLNVTPTILAEVDDMAMVRLLTREDAGVALAPAVVLADEIASGRIVTAPFDLGVRERFYAITKRRSFPHPVLADLLDAAASHLPDAATMA